MGLEARVGFGGQGQLLWHRLRSVGSGFASTAEQNQSFLNSIIQLLVSVTGQAERPAGKDLWSLFLSSPMGKVFRQNELIAKSNATADEALSIALRAVQAGILGYVFRLRTDKLVSEVPNSWRTDPEFYRHKFVTDDGEVIDGEDPRMVEVGFSRLSENAEDVAV